MRDKGLDIILMILFGTGGITVLVLASTWAGPLTERITTIVVGSFGLIWVFVRLLRLMLAQTKINVEKNLTDVEAEKSTR